MPVQQLKINVGAVGLLCVSVIEQRREDKPVYCSKTKSSLVFTSETNK